jgi:class 3 adenylate cyclase
VVGFTDMSREMEATSVSYMLDRLYSKFDALCKEFNVFKMETIGDAYIAVTNMQNDQNEDHAAILARFALRAAQASSETLIDESDPGK